MDNNTLKNLSLSEKSRLLTGGGYWTTAAVNKSGVCEVRFSDGPTGLRPQGKKGDFLGGFKSFPATCFPTHSAVACSWNKNLCEEIGAGIGEEANFYGVDVVLAPGLNIKRNPLCGRNFEYFSEDPYFNGVMGAAFSDGLKSSGAEACLKHFAVNNREFARMVYDSVADERTLREIYLTGFEIAVKKSKPAAVMTAYNRVNGVYCNENGHLIGDVLRGEWGFDGIVVSDWGGTADRTAAVIAGADLEMPPCRFTASELEKEVARGALKEEQIDDCAERIIKLSKREKRAVSCDFNRHAELALKAAEECAVLLKNDGALPLKNKKIALIGEIAESPLIQGGGSSKVNPKNIKTLLNCLKDKITGYAKGYTRSGKRHYKSALKLCKDADTVIFCAGHYGDLEGVDRENLSIPDNQTDLLKKITALKKEVVVVLFCGSAVETDWDNDVNSLLYAGLSGEFGAEAAAEILFGAVCPSGKLTETFPLKLSDVPSSEYFAKQPYAEIYGEAENVGYRYFYGRKQKYPFGFGLSYTEFEYSQLSVDESGASFNITNAGEVRGGETAQLYIGFPDGAHSSEIQLKGFEKVFLDAGESVRVKIPFDEYSFRSYDTVSGKWTEVSGRYKIFIGSSSEHMRLEAYIDREGCVQSVPPPDTSSLIAKDYPLNRTKRGRIIADYRTPLCELKNSKGLLGRLFARIALGAVKRNKTVYGSMQYLPLRTLAQFGKMKKKTLDVLIKIFNGGRK